VEYTLKRGIAVHEWAPAADAKSPFPLVDPPCKPSGPPSEVKLPPAEQISIRFKSFPKNLSRFYCDEPWLFRASSDLPGVPICDPPRAIDAGSGAPRDFWILLDISAPVEPIF